MSGSAHDDETLLVDSADASRRSDGGRSPEVLARGDAVGRYVVLARLGAGGMGVVYGAYDPELDRKVAIKLLHGSELVRDASDGHRRLLREAQALARLGHPNVIAVHDVGEHDGRVYLAMEFVEGVTLARWRDATTHAWREVLEVFLAAARGLAAAHAQGLVHRDFKPDNVMVGVDGRVRVMDFGLARPTRTAAPIEDAEDVASGSVLNTELTRAGSVVGTPAYMAPEQYRGRDVGPAADQFSFCVALWEALYGQRPFVGSSLAELSANVTQGNRCPPPPGVAVPRWLRRACERGLATDPEERFADMPTLLATLQRGHARARLRQATVALGALALVGAGVGSYRYVEHARLVAACDAEGEAIAASWNDDTRTRLREAMLGSGVGYAETTADKVMPWLEDQARAWSAARTQACARARIEARWADDVLERSRWCLDERALELGAVVHELSRGDATSIERAVQAAAGLRRVDACLDEDVLARLPAPPAEQRADVEAVRTELSQAAALQATGAYEQGSTVARGVLQRAEELAWPPLRAAARLRVGMLLEDSGAYADAEAMLESAYFDAADAKAHETALAAANRLVHLVGHRIGRHADGLRWAKLAGLARSELPDPAGLNEAASLSSVAAVHTAMGAFAEARALHERVLAIREVALGPEHPETAVAINNVAIVLASIGAHDEAKAMFERAIVIWEQALGPEHPQVAVGLNNLAYLQQQRGEYGDARMLHERALALLERSVGADHPEVADSLGNLAAVHQLMGDFERAEALHQRALIIRRAALGAEHPHVATTLDSLATIRAQTGARDEARELRERALAIREKAQGPDHPELADTLNNLAIDDHYAGAFDRAVALHERAIAIRRTALGPDHPELANSLTNLGNTQHAMGAHAEAKASFEEALAIRERFHGRDHPEVAGPLLGLAEVALAQHDPARAVELAERALQRRESAGSPAIELASVRFVLARALAAIDPGSARSTALAEQARDAYRDAGAARRTRLAEVQAWLATRARD